MDKFKKIEDKLDFVAEKIHAIDVTLALNTMSLDTHIKRTNLLEESVALLRKDFKPVSGHVTFVNNLAKLIVFLGVLAAIYKNLK